MCERSQITGGALCLESAEEVLEETFGVFLCSKQESPKAGWEERKRCKEDGEDEGEARDGSLNEECEGLVAYLGPC